MSDSGKIKAKKKVSLYVGNKTVGSEIIRKRGKRLFCFTVVKAVQKRNCTKGEMAAKKERINKKYHKNGRRRHISDID